MFALFFLAFCVGIWGYLNLGVINLNIINISTQKNKKTLVGFILCAFLFEMLYCFGVLWSLKYIFSNDILRNFLKILTILICFLFSFLAFQSAQNTLKNEAKTPSKTQENLLKNDLYFAYFAVIIHPQQISFWSIWGIYFLQNKYISDTFWDILMMALGAGFGALGFFIFLSFLGKIFIHEITQHRQKIHYAMALLMFFLGVKTFFE